MPRADEPRGQSDRGGDQRPEHEKRRFGPQETDQKGASIDPLGHDAGKGIKGKKRHILVDTTGLMPQAIVHAADIQDRGGGAMLMATLFGLFPFLLKLYADGGCQKPEFRKAMAEVLRKSTRRSRSGQIQPKAFWSCRSAGWSNGRLHD